MHRVPMLIDCGQVKIKTILWLAGDEMTIHYYPHDSLLTQSILEIEAANKIV